MQWGKVIDIVQASAKNSRTIQLEGLNSCKVYPMEGDMILVSFASIKEQNTLIGEGGGLVKKKFCLL